MNQPDIEMASEGQNIPSSHTLPENHTSAQLYGLIHEVAQSQENDRAQLHEIQALLRRLVDQGAPVEGTVPPPATEATATAPPLDTPVPLTSSLPDPTPTDVAQPSAPLSTKRKPLPAGDPFDGDKARFPAWKIHLQYKIRCDADFIGHGEAQFHFIWSCLSAKVQGTVKAFYASGGYSMTWDPAEFFNYLEFCFRDAHAMERAQVQLDAMEQGKRESFSVFFVRFNTTLHEAGGADWADEQKLHRLRRALTPTMKNVALNRGVSRTDYAAAVELYHRIAVDIETAAFEAHHHGTQGSSGPKRDSDGDTPMVTIAALQSNRNGQRGSTPRRGNWIPQDLFDERRAAKVCTRCADPAHSYRDCRNALVINTAATTGTDTNSSGKV